MTGLQLLVFGHPTQIRFEHANVLVELDATVKIVSVSAAVLVEFLSFVFFP